MTSDTLDNDGRRQPGSALSSTNGGDAKAVPFRERLSCTIDEACMVTGLGCAKL